MMNNSLIGIWKKAPRLSLHNCAYLPDPAFRRFIRRQMAREVLSEAEEKVTFTERRTDTPNYTDISASVIVMTGAELADLLQEAYDLERYY